MMPVEWPLAASAVDRPVDPARLRAGCDRLPVVMADFFLDEAKRLTDEERALIAALLRGLIATIADELISALPPLLAARAEHCRDGLYRRLRRAGLLERPDMIALLLRRADEQQMTGQGEHIAGPFLSGLLNDADGGIAEAAMALVLARGRRRDRFGRIGVEFDDLAAEDAIALGHAVAAALGDGLGGESDVEIAAACGGLLGRHDEGRRLEAVLLALVRALDAAQRIQCDIVRSAAADRDVALVAGFLARMAGVDLVDAWQLFSSGQAMMLARLAGCDRQTAAHLVAAFLAPASGGDEGRGIEAFDSINEEAVERCRAWLKLDPLYRDAREALGSLDG